MQLAILLCLVSAATGAIFYGPMDFNWADGRQYCINRDAWLYAPTSIADLSAVNHLNLNVWTGWSDQGHEGLWQDTKGNTMQHSWGLWNWLQPDNFGFFSSENCAARDTWKLNDIRCSSTRPIICEYDEATEAPVTVPPPTEAAIEDPEPGLWALTDIFANGETALPDADGCYTGAEFVALFPAAASIKRVYLLNGGDVVGARVEIGDEDVYQNCGAAYRTNVDGFAPRFCAATGISGDNLKVTAADGNTVTICEFKVKTIE
jgi:hypothetical protein